MPDSGQTIGIIAFLLLILFSISIIPYNPILGLVVLFTAVIILAMSMDPSSAKIMMKLFLPIIIILLILGITVDYIGGINREISIILVVILFAATLIMGAIFGGIHTGSGLALAPMIIIPTLIALLVDPSGSLAVVVASVLLFGWMFFVYLLTRNPPPPYPVGFGTRVGKAVTDIAPNGKVKIGAEIWDALSPDFKISKGEEVYIVKVRNLELLVEPALRCPHCGEPYPITDIPLNCRACGKPLLELKIRAEEYIKEKGSSRAIFNH
ncbi:MAG: NfeD family protein [Candidatus Njordarchaeia archaeon]